MRVILVYRMMHFVQALRLKNARSDAERRLLRLHRPEIIQASFLCVNLIQISLCGSLSVIACVIAQGAVAS